MDGGELCGQFLDASGLAPQKGFPLPGTHQGAEQAAKLGRLIRERQMTDRHQEGKRACSVQALETL